MACIGFSSVKERWKPEGKVGYWLFRKSEAKHPNPNDGENRFRKKNVLQPGSNRNNFCILLGE
jgi:25S rRNA (adenine2142-N1)-methyltransferase